MKKIILFLLLSVSCAEPDQSSLSSVTHQKNAELINKARFMNEKDVEAFLKLVKNKEDEKIRKFLSDIKINSKEKSSNQLPILNPQEEKICLVSWETQKKCATILATGSYAFTMARLNYPLDIGKLDKRQDAFRHALWMGMSAYYVGKNFALKFGEAHEYGSSSYSSSSAISSLRLQMDLFNNEAGANSGLSTTNDYRRLIKNGNLKIIINNRIVPSNTDY